METPLRVAPKSRAAASSATRSVSPIIAMKAVIDQPRPIQAKVDFHFIELDERRADHLNSEIELLKLPPKVSTKVHANHLLEN